MAETVLVRPDLTADMIAGGRTLLGYLDQLDIPVEAAFWLLDEDVPAWHLVLASPQMRTQGSIAMYRKVDKALGKLQLRETIWIGMVSVVDPHAKIVQLLVDALGMTTSVDGARLDNATIGGVRISGCLLYRLVPKSSKLAPRRAGMAAAE